MKKTCKYGHTLTARHCRICNKERASKHYYANRESHLTRSRERYLERVYGMKECHVDLLLDSQHWKCAICQCSLAGVSGRDRHIDHQHGTKIVRGILCQNCNKALGLFKESHTVLLRAYEYLLRHVPGLEKIA